MQLAADSGSKGHSPALSWRISLDRAWRSEDMRRTFEAETGYAPLASDPGGRWAQSASGGAQAYHDRFILWATRYLDLEDQAPPAIKRKLAGGR